MLLLIRSLWLDVICIVIRSFQFRLLTQNRREAGEWRPRRAAGRVAFLRGRATFRLHPPYCENEGRNGSRKSKKNFLESSGRGGQPRKGGRIRRTSRCSPGE